MFTEEKNGNPGGSVGYELWRQPEAVEMARLPRERVRLRKRGKLNVSAQAESTEEALKNINAGDEDLSEITVAFYNTIVPTKDNISRIEDAINDITIPEIHTKVTLNIISMGQWDQQINLMLSSGEKLDLMPTFFAGSTAFNTMSGTNQLAPLNDLLDSMGRESLKLYQRIISETTKL